MIRSDKSYSYWLARFNRKMSFHFPWVVLLISDRSVWHNGSIPAYSCKVSSHGLQMKINKKMLALAYTFDELELKRLNFVVDSQQNASVWIPGESIFHFISIPESTRTATASAGFLPQTQ